MLIFSHESDGFPVLALGPQKYMPSLRNHNVIEIRNFIYQNDNMYVPVGGLPEITYN